MVAEFSLLSRRTRTMFGLSPWLIVGVSVILGMAVLYLALRDAEREKRRVEENLLDRANALIWALEAGTRTWMGYESERNVLQLLVNETAKQPGIKYIAVADENGNAIAHSNPEKLGRGIDAAFEIEELSRDASGWREITDEGVPIFEAYREFAPIREGHDSGEMGHSGGSHHGRGRMRGEKRIAAPAAARKSVVMVGMDMRPFQESLTADFQNTLLSAAIVAALGLTGFISMFWAHNYRRSRRMLMNTQALASEVVTSLPLGLMTIGVDGKIGMANAAAALMLGRPESGLAGSRLDEVPAIDWAGVVSELAAGGKVLERETELTNAEGKPVPVRLSASQIRNAEGEPLGHIFIFGDLGEVKRLQSEVQRNERLTALGNLAAGVAHEIRNPLSTIKGLATYMARKLPPGGSEEEAAKTMIEEVNRLNNVVSELLALARPGVAKGGAGDVGSVVSRALRLAEADIKGRGVRVEFKNGTENMPVTFNPERLTQAILNLLLNAVQAMEPGGTLRVATEGRPLAGEILVTVEDDGQGMTEEVQKSIFNPYFTTKSSGTGLGLAIVHQIVESHGGRVSVKSAPGAGAAFTIHLPVEKR